MKPTKNKRIQVAAVTLKTHPKSIADNNKGTMAFLSRELIVMLIADNKDCFRMKPD